MTQSKTYLISTAGSHGDVLPFMALAEGLIKQNPNNRVIIYATPLFEKFTPENVIFRPTSTNEFYYEMLKSFHENNPLKSIQKIMKVMQQVTPMIIEEMRKDIGVAPNNTVVIGSSVNPAPHLLAELYNLPFVSVHLAPLQIKSTQKIGRVLPFFDKIVEWNNPIVNKLFLQIMNLFVLNSNFVKPLNKIRQQYGLNKLNMSMLDWINSANLVIGLFDEKFGNPQSDWANIKIVGFPYYQQHKCSTNALNNEIVSFLEKDIQNKPVLFCAGTATSNAHQFFKTSYDACLKMNIRAIFVNNIKDQFSLLPNSISDNILLVDYVPYEQVLPLTSGFVHHGGIGSTAIALKSKVPQLIRPCAFDQFDNSRRITEMGLGVEILPKDYTIDNVVQSLQKMFNLDLQKIQQTLETEAVVETALNGIDKACQEIIKITEITYQTKAKA